MAKDPDEDDLRRVIAGDGQAAARLYDKYAFRIYRLAYLSLRDEGDAEEVMQETFLRLWGQGKRWKAGTPLLPWLLRVASNLSTDRIRKRSKIVFDAPPEQVDPGSSGFHKIQENQIEQRLRWALAKLPARQREALQLTWNDSLSNADAGMVLGISEQALESLLARARRNLRKWLLPFRDDLLGEDDDT